MPRAAKTPQRTVTQFINWWFAPAPACRLALVRVLVGGFAMVQLVADIQSQQPLRGGVLDFDPVGIVTVLSRPLPPSWVSTIEDVALLAGAGFTLGVWFQITGPLFAASFTWVLSYRSSWGVVFHTENLVALHLILLAASPAADRLCLWRPGASDSKKSPSPECDRRYGWPLRAMAVVLVATYVLAGTAKLKLAGLDWGGGDILRRHVAQMAVRNIESGVESAVLAEGVVRCPELFAPLSCMVLLCELSAPVALLGKRFAIGWCVAIWAFHVGVFLSMAVVFPYPLSGIAFAPLFPVEQWLRGHRRSRRERSVRFES